MLANPSTDFYDDAADDDEDDSDDGFYDDEKDEEAPETLPKPESLSIAPVDAKETQTAAVKVPDDEEFVDMGYDEDDERIAITVERPKTHNSAGVGSAQLDNKDFMLNEEGSGANRYKNNVNDRLRLEYLDKYHRKEQKVLGEHVNKDINVEEPRESSGNFANDDDNDNSDDDDDDDDAVGSEAKNEDGSFFHPKRKSNSRYFRKNTNDAIKIISTPLGKVGIVYQQTPTEEGSEKKAEAEANKKATSFTDFDALSPDPESSHRLASSHPKITPVLTPDGKVALLYRGDSESSKYEPIRNMTHKFNNNSMGKNGPTDNKTSANSNKDTNNDNDSESESSAGSVENAEEHTPDETAEQITNDSNSKPSNEEPGGPFPHFSAVDPTSGSFIIRPTDSVLPMINRPLSEVLGIKKNQFKQFRVKDIPTTSTTPAATSRLAYDQTHAISAAASASATGAAASNGAGTTTLLFHTKVNLADYPTRARNHDFDFSRDHTMLDERTRHRQQQEQQSQMEAEHQLNTIANEEVLSKTEVVNLAIIPHFDEEIERLQRLREHEIRRHHRQRHRHKQTEEDLSGIHCIMQAMMGIAAISTVFGMLGTFFKQRILDQLRLLHW